METLMLIKALLKCCLNKGDSWLGFLCFVVVFFKFYTTETESYFLKCQAVVSHTAQHILKHFPVMKYKVQICIYRTAGLVNVNFTAPYMGVKHYSLLAPIF